MEFRNARVEPGAAGGHPTSQWDATGQPGVSFWYRSDTTADTTGIADPLRKPCKYKQHNEQAGVAKLANAPDSKSAEPDPQPAAIPHDSYPDSPFSASTVPWGVP